MGIFLILAGLLGISMTLWELRDGYIVAIGLTSTKKYYRKTDPSLFWIQFALRALATLLLIGYGCWRISGRS